MSGLAGMRVGYVPYDRSLERPGDRRRFVFYARRRRVPFEVVGPETRVDDLDVVVLSGGADVSRWAREEVPARLVVDLVNPYLGLARRGVRNRLRGAARFAVGAAHRPVLDLGAAIEELVARADAAVCSTEEQADAARRRCDDVHVVLDSFSDVAGLVKHDYRAGSPLHLVWEGRPENLAGFEALRPALEDFAEEHHVAVHLVTGSRHSRYMGRFVTRPSVDVAEAVLGERLAASTYLYSWNEHMLGRIVTACDLAVVPLRLDDPFEAAKPANKLLGFWWMGMPTLVSASPAYRRMAEAVGLPDVACGGSDEWLAALCLYAGSETARVDAGRRGRAHVVAEHADEALLARWDAVFDAALGDDARGAGSSGDAR